MPRLVIALITSMVAVSLAAQKADRPKMLVGIVIDGLDSQYLDLLRAHFGQDGFNRLFRDGILMTADYGTNVDATAAVAMALTGASPSTTSITGTYRFNRDTRQTIEILRDTECKGTLNTDPFSPRILPVSTLSDEVRIAGGGIGRSYSIAASPSVAVLLGGHSANCAMWLDRNNGNWVTSSYYADQPLQITRLNRLQPMALRVDTMQWTPLRAVDAYPGLPESVTHYPFRYTFPRGNAAVYDMFASSPKMNEEITDVSIRLIDEVNLGGVGATDVLNVAYCLQPYNYTKNDDNRYELMDAYLRLDVDLARLFKTVESKTGEHNAVFFVVATPPASVSRRDDERWNIPYTEFSTKKAVSLLNMYLMAKFGNGEWISAYYDKQFYLNHKLISDNNLDPRAVRSEAASFLARMSGVDHVYTLDEVVTGRTNALMEAIQRNTYAPEAGDLYIEVDPGCELVDDLTTPAKSERVRYVKRIVAPTAQVFIIAPDVAAQKVTTPVDIRVLAPTVARLLRIRSPNGAALPPLVF